MITKTIERLPARLFMMKFQWHTLFGTRYQMRLRTLFSVSSKILIPGLLQKNKKNRLTLKEVHDHPWVVKNQSKSLIDQRRKSSDMGDKLAILKAYTATEEEKKEK